MDLENIPENPSTDEEYNKCYSLFLDALDKKNDDVINLLVTKKGFLLKQFYWEKETCLHIVTKRGSISTLIQLCKFGADVNAKNRKGETPLYHAIKHSSEMVKILLENSAKIDTLCQKGVSPLHQALLQGSPETLKLIANKALSAIDKNHPKETNLNEIIKNLLTRRAELKLLKKDLPLVIFFAAKNGEKDLFNHVLNECRKCLASNHESTKKREKKGFYRKERYVPRAPEEVNLQGYFDRTALHYAVRQQLPEVVRFLLQEKADVNCKTRNNYTPLHYAACLENLEICEILLSFGAEVDPNRKENPLFLVCGRSEARNLLESGDGYYYEEFHNTMINRMNSYYEPTPIFNPKIMNLLLKSGAKPDLPGDDGMTPFLEACRAGNLQAVKILLQFGANFQTRDDQQNSALHYAAIGNSLEIVQLLLDRGFDLEVRNVDGYTPLLSAAQNERQTCLEVIEYLVDHGADVNAKNAEDATALHIAAYFDSKEVIECLLELGADVKLQFDPDSVPVLGNVLSSMYFCGMGSGRETLTSFVALKEDHLGEYINCYIRDGMQEAADHFRKAKLELKELKSRKIFKETRISFHDFLVRDFYNAVQISKGEEVMAVFKSGSYKKDFPCYGYLLEQRFKRIENLRNSVDMTENFMLNYGNNPLSNLVVRKILSHLRSIDFRIFGRILSRR